MEISGYSTGAICYKTDAKKQYRQWVFENTLKNKDKRKTHSIAFFDAHTGQESKFWTEKLKNVELFNIERCPNALSAWSAWAQDLSDKAIGLNMNSTDFLKLCPGNLNLIHLDYIGFMSKDKIRDLKIINKRRNAEYLCINLQDIKNSVRHHSNDDLRREIEKLQYRPKNATLYFLKKYLKNYELISEYKYTSAVKPMRAYVFKLKGALK